MRLKNMVTVITGSGSGIGRETALLFAKEGAVVILVDIDENNGKETMNKIKEQNGEAGFYQVDITQEAEVQKFVNLVIKKYRKIDVLFNNAGISSVGRMDNIACDTWNQVMNVNVNGVYLMSKYAVKHMMNEKKGSIINMSSSIAQMGVAERTAYAATKGAVLSMTKAMQVDYAKYNIRVNALMPGTIYTPFVEKYIANSENPDAIVESIKKRQLTKKLGKPIDIAYAALYLASDESTFMMGSSFIIDGGLANGK
ncbi:SDR family NAD(P)-dependent oxidoreductase [Virgibacillus doumboii]|uniref:SDR family NAD(P)-dependent oxidoreductase n=1 Tax=Virgibacillus doumboii TaxID=2697503 RepID=UPI0013DFDC31|nr:SDR family oxidoreductase [Virgibacillus doumboii]